MTCLSHMCSVVAESEKVTYNDGSDQVGTNPCNSKSILLAVRGRPELSTLHYQKHSQSTLFVTPPSLPREYFENVAF